MDQGSGGYTSDRVAGHGYLPSALVTGVAQVWQVPNRTPVTVGARPAGAVLAGTVSWSAVTDASGNFATVTGKTPARPGFTTYYQEASAAQSSPTKTIPVLVTPFGAKGENVAIPAPAPTPPRTPVAPTPVVPVPIVQPVVQTG